MYKQAGVLTVSYTHLGLLAAQMGSEKKQATNSAKIKLPIFEEIEVPSGSATVTLSKTPAGTGAAGIPYIYKLNGDSTIATKYTYGSTDAASQFTFNGTTLTFPTGLNAGDMIFVVYEYEADGTEGNGGVSVEGNAVDFPKAGKFVMEVLGCDVCDPSTLYYAYVIFPQAKLMSDFDLSFTTDGKHPFSMKAMQQYCDHSKKLFQVAIPEM